jgi:hypothetical protein
MQKRLHSSVRLTFSLLIAMSSAIAFGQATQTPVQPIVATGVPRLVKFSGLLKDVSGNLLTNTVGITFAVYSEETGGVPLWQETQNVQLSQGRYTVFLGEGTSGGIPAELFASGQSQWLGIRILLPGEEEEQARLFLTSVPYALKAVDADTLGGLPASSFLRAEVGAPSNAIAAPTNPTSSSTKNGAPPPSSPVTTSGGTVGTIPVFSTAADIENSPIVSSGGTIGIAAPLTVSGASTLAGVTAQSVNGVLNAALFPGLDIGAQVTAAIAALGCGVIYVPKGTYLQTTMITLPMCITLAGAGIDATQLTWKGGSCSPNNGGCSGTQITINTLGNIAGGIRDMNLADGTASNTATGVAIGNSSTTKAGVSVMTEFENVQFYGFSLGVAFSNNAWLWTCRHCIFASNITGVYVPAGTSNTGPFNSGENMRITDSVFTQNTTYAINQAGAYAPYWSFKISNTSFDYNGNGTSAPIQGGFISTANHFEQAAGPFFDTTTGGGVEDTGSVFYLANTSTAACLANLATGNNYLNTFVGTLFSSTTTVTDLFCNNGPLELIGVRSSGGVTLPAPNYLTSNLMVPQLSQTTLSSFAGTSACAGGTQAISLSVTYVSQPVVLVSDQSTAGGARVSSRSTSGFTVACNGASDIFDWMVVGNPN